MDDDDEFGSDGGFEDLPANTLARLEQDAFRSTQHKSAAPSRRSVLDGDYQTFIGPARSFTYGGANDPSNIGQPPLEYGLDDEDVLDLNDLPDEVQQKLTQWPQPRLQPNNHTATVHSRSIEQPNGNSVPNNDDVAELRRRLLQLENEKDGLQRAVQEAQAFAQAKTGEVSLLRQRVDKTTREYESRISILRQSHAESDARQKAELAALQSDREKMAIDNRFLEHDLVLEAGRNRQMSRPQRTNGNPSPVTTPRKNRILPYRDGFEDGDIMQISPSRSRTRSNPSTPKAVGKRKRDAAAQSPIRSLALQPIDTSPGAKERAVAQAKENTELTRRLTKEQENSRFVDRLLQYKPVSAAGQDSLADTLSKFMFPKRGRSAEASDGIPKGLFSNIVLDALARRNFTAHPQGVAGAICDVFVTLWGQCLEREYHQPIDVLVEVITFICHSQRLRFAQSLSARVVPLAVATCDLIAIPLAVAARKTGNLEEAVSSSAPVIEILDVLALLSRIAQACALRPHAIQDLWQMLKFDFILVMLMNVQPLPQIISTLQLLATSILPDSFGSITTQDDPRRVSRENDSIKRLSLLLFDKFATRKRISPGKSAAKSAGVSDSDEDQNQMNDLEDEKKEMILRIRLETIAIFMRLCMTDYGSRLIANHRFVIVRLVRFLHNCVSELYTFSAFTHDYCIEAINTTTRIIHQVVTTNRANMDIKERIRAEKGGHHQWLLVLTRLAFADGVVAEAGITSETSDMAHDLLDEYLSPDEGEQLLKMVATATSDD